MTYEYRIINDRPLASFALDETPFRDFSGNDIIATGQRVRNYAVNPFFDTTPTMGGLGSAPATRGFEENYSMWGRRSALTTVSSSSANPIGASVAATFPIVNSARSITWGMWISASFARGVFPYAEWTTAANAYGGGQGSGPTQTLSSGWKWVQGTISLPAGAKNVRVGFLTGGAVTAGEKVWVSSVIAVEGSSLNINDFDYSAYVGHRDGFTPKKNPPASYSLVSGGGGSAIVNANNTLDIRNPLTTTTYTLESWVKPVDVSSDTVVLGGASDLWGLSINDESIRFRAVLSDLSTIDTLYFPPVSDKVFHVAGVRDNTSIRLYVDGGLVAETALTPEQMLLGNRAYELISSGWGSGDSIIVDGTAIYDRGIDAETVYRHYVAGTQVQDYKSLVASLGGSYWTFTDAEAQISEDIIFGDWSNGELSNVYSDGSVLLPEVAANDLTYGGSWLYGTILPASVDGSRVMWDGDGDIVVQTSIDDDTTWQNVTNGREVPGLSGGFDGTERSLSIRVLFTSGEPADTITKMRSLRVTLYSSRSAVNNEGAQFAIPSGSVALADHEYPILEKHPFMGLDVYDGSLLLTPRNLDETGGATKSVEMWVKFEGTEDGNLLTVGDAYLRRAGGRWEYNGLHTFVNGSRAEFNPTPGVWQHLVIVLDFPTTDAITIGKLIIKLGVLSAYRETLDDQKAGLLFNNYLGIAPARMYEESAVAVTDSGVEPKIYAYNWSIVSV